MPKMKVNGIDIAYDDVGTGENVIIFVHGHPFDRSMWTPQHRLFVNSGWRALVPDLRGYGETTVVDGKTGLDSFARDIVALANSLQINKFVIAGLSMGGQIAMEICRMFPKRIRGVVLAATTPQAETENGKVSRNMMADRLLEEGMSAYAEEVLPKMVAPSNIAAQPAVAKKVLDMMRAAHPIGGAAALRGRAERPDYVGTLRTLNIPALIVVGDQDGFTTRADAELMRNLIAGSELIWMNGVGHMPNLEREIEFNAALEAFLASVPVSGAKVEA